MQPAQYQRISKNWHRLLGMTGVVILTTRLEVTTRELENFLPYSFLLIELDAGSKDGKKKKLEIMGEARTVFSVGERIRLELRKSGIPNETEIIPYELKACKLS